MTTGVLALQGAFGLHRDVLESLGEATVEVRTPGDLDIVDRLVIPGGESSVIAMLAQGSGLLEKLQNRINSGLPTLGTCAGAILLASEILDGRPGQSSLGVIDMAVRRNAFGRQADSFTALLEIHADMRTPTSSGEDTSMTIRAVFIRAPAIERTGADVEVLAHYRGEPVMVRRGRVIATTFHPELSGDPSVHQLFLGL